jgi:hypothetical protein
MTMYFGDENKPSLESLVLEHHGVKGMHWGVRHERDLQYHKSIAAGKGSKLQRANYAVKTASLHEMIKHNGDINKIAAARVVKLEKEKARITSGHATVSDAAKRIYRTSQLTPVQLITKGKRRNLTD